MKSSGWHELHKNRYVSSALARSGPLESHNRLPLHCLGHAQAMLRLKRRLLTEVR